MKLRVFFGLTAGIFALPCEIVDQYINDAPADTLRVLLYLYRHGGTLDSETLCDALHIKEKTLLEALAFWSDKQLFTLDAGQTTSAAAEAAAQIAPQPKPQKAKSTRPALESPTQYTSTDIVNRSKNNAEIRFLLDTAPTLLGRLLSPADCSTLLYLYDSAGLPADVILMLLEYCVSTGHTNLRYLEKVAFSWAEDGIDTHEKAEQRILQLESLHSFEGQIRSIMGITGRALTASERQHMVRWSNEWNTPPELVRTAFDICVKRTGKLSFSYINSILKTWHEKGYTTAEQAQNERREPARQSGGKASTYDINEYVDLSMKRLLGDK
ncbi:MAG: DnaD domain protein [Ethanoligenens sp.]